MQTTWNTIKRTIANSSEGTSIDTQGQAFPTLIIMLQRPILNKAPIEYLNELEINMKIVFKDLSYATNIMPLEYPVRTQQPVDLPAAVVTINGNSIAPTNPWYNQIPNPQQS